MIKTTEDIRKELLAKRQKQAEESRKKEEVLNSAKDVVQDLHTLGLRYQDIIVRCNVSEEFLNEVFSSLRLRISPIFINSTPAIPIGDVGADLGVKSESDSVSTDKFGAPRWTNDLAVHLEDSSSSESESSEPESEIQDRSPVRLPESGSGSEVQTIEAELDEANSMENTEKDTEDIHRPEEFERTSNVEEDEEMQWEDEEKDTEPPQEGLETAEPEPMNLQIEIEKVQVQIRAMQARKAAKDAQRASKLKIMSLGNEFREVVLKRQAVMRRLGGLRVDKLRRKVAVQEERLSQLKAELGAAVSQESEVNSQLSMLLKREGTIRDEISRAKLKVDNEIQTHTTHISENNPRETEAVTEEPTNTLDYQEIPVEEADAGPEAAHNDSEVPRSISSGEEKTHDGAGPVESQGELESLGVYHDEGPAEDISPLQIFSSWRFSPALLNQASKCFSPSLNSRFLPSVEEKFLCGSEASGFNCSKRGHCKDIHADDFDIPAQQILEYMGSCTIGKDPQSFKIGLRDYIQRLGIGQGDEHGSVEEKLARSILEYRRTVDDTSYLDWNRWEAEL